MAYDWPYLVGGFGFAGSIGAAFLVRYVTILVLTQSLAILFAGCSSNSARVIDMSDFLNVQQERHQCGPNTLSIILRYWGVDKTPQEISSEIYNPALRGTLSLSMLLYAKLSGLDAFLYAGTISDLRKKINDGYPVVLALARQEPMVHFVVIYGYKGDKFIMYDGINSAVLIHQEEMQRLWKKAGNMILLVYPRGRHISIVPKEMR